MQALDRDILQLLVDDGRISFAEIGRRLSISRAYARERVAQLCDDGVIEQFTAVVDPEKLGIGISAFLDVKVAPHAIEALGAALAERPEVISLYLMSDMQSLHIHTLTESEACLDAFVSAQLFGNDAVRAIHCTTLLRRLKNRRGGPRI